MTDCLVSFNKVSKTFGHSSVKPSVAAMLWGLTGFKKKEVLRATLRDLSFEMPRHARVALLGRNGAGKSTLLRLIVGTITPSSGEIEVNSHPHALFWLFTGFSIELSVEDNIRFLGLLFGTETADVDSLTRKVLTFSDLVDKRVLPVKNLSSGQAQRLAVAVFLMTCGDFLILDESFAGLDQAFSVQCERFLFSLQEKGCSMLLSSHDPMFLGRHCSHGLWIEDGRLRAYGALPAILDEYQHTHRAPLINGEPSILED